MVGSDYGGWSDHLIGHLKSGKDYAECCRTFREALGRPEATAKDLLKAYKVGLAQLGLRYKSYLSPSTFALDEDGTMPDPRDEGRDRGAEEIAAERTAGLLPKEQGSREFVPLPRELRDKRGDLVEEFAAGYDVYKRKLVVPWVRALKSCDALIVLVDVVGILSAGHGMFYDTRQIVRDLLEVLRPGLGPIGKAVRAVNSLFWHPGGITRIAILAPKVDLVKPTERDKASHLVRQMVQKLVADYAGIDARYWACSAAASADWPEGGDQCLGLVRDPATGKVVERKFPACCLPDDWPLEWPPPPYKFPLVRPRIPKRMDCAPDHINLNAVLDFVMGQRKGLPE